MHGLWESAEEDAQSVGQRAKHLLMFAGTLALPGGAESVKRCGAPGQAGWFWIDGGWGLGQVSADTWNVNPAFQERLAEAWRTAQDYFKSSDNTRHIVITEEITEAPEGRHYLTARPALHPQLPGLRALIQKATGQDPERIIRFDIVEGPRPGGNQLLEAP